MLNPFQRVDAHAQSGARLCRQDQLRYVRKLFRLSNLPTLWLGSATAALRKFPTDCAIQPKVAYRAERRSPIRRASGRLARTPGRRPALREQCEKRPFSTPLSSFTGNLRPALHTRDKAFSLTNKLRERKPAGLSSSSTARTEA